MQAVCKLSAANEHFLKSKKCPRFIINFRWIIFEIDQTVWELWRIKSLKLIFVWFTCQLEKLPVHTWSQCCSCLLTMHVVPSCWNCRWFFLKTGMIYHAPTAMNISDFEPCLNNTVGSTTFFKHGINAVQGYTLFSQQYSSNPVVYPAHVGCENDLYQ